MQLQGFVITRPTPAYEVLERVVYLIEDEYKRLRMSHWLVENANRTFSDSDAPACNTIGCMSGWIAYVSDHKEAACNAAYLVFEVGSPGWTELRKAFTNGDAFFSPDGTREQAELAVEFLKGLMKKYEPELRNRLVLPTIHAKETR